ncbi:MAG: DUF4349 domain-containing protein [Defluviitaleaceae bacterium]|nr:DUF4349 domain-containing protein [Defluviitaleaceae bacterium]MCL2240803.1 DUF4349 domain-containing protein [Defluviitaleaceae bacterium]
MGRVLAILCVLAAGMVFAVPVSAADRRMHQGYTIEITVECLDAAIAALHGLEGFNVSSSVTFVEPHTGLNLRQASFTRRVDVWAFRHTQAMLRELGEVTSERENARHLGAELTQLDTRLEVLAQELERLSVLMAASTTLEVLIAVDNQINWVSRERDRLMGRRNQLMADAQRAEIQIWLTEETYVPPVSAGFGRRVSDSFLGSWNALLRNAGNFTVFMARASLPLAIWLVILGAVLWAVTRQMKKRRVKRMGAIHETITGEAGHE